MTILNTLKNIFSTSSKKEKMEAVVSPSGNGGNADASNAEAASIPESMTPPRSETITPPQPEPEPQQDMPPGMRRVVKAPVLSEGNFPEQSDKVLIKAQPSATGDQCLFLVNRTLFEGHSWLFPTFESAEGSPLAERLFSLEDVETVLVHEATVTITRKDKTIVDWKPLAIEVGAAIRELLESGEVLISRKIIDEMPAQEVIQQGIQKALDEEVNPGVAGHGGQISLTRITGNTITIHMGGGCQGCSAADLTLKQGIHTTFRKYVPQVGAIFDETDHSAGLNPYF